MAQRVIGGKCGGNAMPELIDLAVFPYWKCSGCWFAIGWGWSRIGRCGVGDQAGTQGQLLRDFIRDSLPRGVPK